MCVCVFLCTPISTLRSNGQPSSEPGRLFCRALVATYLSETKMDVSVRLLKHAFSPGRRSSGGNRFLAEIDRTERRKQHPHLGPGISDMIARFKPGVPIELLLFFLIVVLLLALPSLRIRRPGGHG